LSVEISTIKKLDRVSRPFALWIGDALMVCRERFGPMANVLKTNVAYVHRQVIEEDYLPDDVEGLSVAQINGLRIEAEKDRNKSVLKDKSKWPAFFTVLQHLLGDDAQQLVKAHADWEEAEDSTNPNILARIIRETLIGS
jgi:hypothetical protein